MANSVDPDQTAPLSLLCLLDVDHPKIRLKYVVTHVSLG